MTKPVSGHQQILARMKKVRSGLPTVMEDAGIDKFLLSRIKRNFDKAIDPEGNPWPKLSPKTIERKRQKGSPYATTPLKESGDLYRSIQIIRGRADGVFAINTGLGVRIGVTSEQANEYAKIQNYGGYSGKPLHRIPARRYFGITQRDVIASRGFVARQINKLLKG